MLDQDYFDFAEIGVGPDCPKCHTPQVIGHWSFVTGKGQRTKDKGHLWYDPGEMVMCETCEGEGGWWHCYECAKRESEEVK